MARKLSQSKLADTDIAMVRDGDNLTVTLRGFYSTEGEPTESGKARRIWRSPGQYFWIRADDADPNKRALAHPSGRHVGFLIDWLLSGKTVAEAQAAKGQTAQEPEGVKRGRMAFGPAAEENGAETPKAAPRKRARRARK